MPHSQKESEAAQTSTAKENNDHSPTWKLLMISYFGTNKEEIKAHINNPIQLSYLNYS
jgi:hypothetical protein